MNYSHTTTIKYENLRTQVELNFYVKIFVSLANQNIDLRLSHNPVYKDIMVETLLNTILTSEKRHLINLKHPIIFKANNILGIVKKINNKENIISY
jgi:hypothetical protein